MKRTKAIVAMSGGVDSSVAAAILVQQGYEVIGITLNVWPKLEDGTLTERADACCSLSAVDDARRVADILGIPHYTLNFRDIFADKVISDFCSEYIRGRTPNPCIRCNEHIKFKALLTKAEGLGVEFIATGHHAQVEYDVSRGRYLLRRGIDHQKDQSYVLYVLSQDQLSHTLMPVGQLQKGQVRQMAADLQLPVAWKEESQEICFVPDNDYGAFIQNYIPDSAKPGPILDRYGRILGQHRGIVFYTIGQRRGLGLANPEPTYVIAIDPNRNALIVGQDRDLYSSDLEADSLNYIAIDQLTRPTTLKAKIRYRSPEADAIATPLPNGRLAVHFAHPQRAITQVRL